MQDSFVEVMLIVLTTGLLAGYVCRQISLPPLMGYLTVGALLGEGALGWVSSDVEEVAHFAEVGVFLLLFSIGLELSFPELRRMGRTLLVGGGLQMLLVAVPIAAILAANSWEWPAAILVGLALAFSSTVLVFKSLGELGQTSTGLGRRAISILLFQDAALVPLLLCVPLLSGAGGVSAADVFPTDGRFHRICGGDRRVALRAQCLVDSTGHPAPQPRSGCVVDADRARRRHAGGIPNRSSAGAGSLCRGTRLRWESLVRAG